MSECRGSLKGTYVIQMKLDTHCNSEDTTVTPERPDLKYSNAAIPLKVLQLLATGAHSGNSLL